MLKILFKSWSTWLRPTITCLAKWLYQAFSYFSKFIKNYATKIWKFKTRVYPQLKQHKSCILTVILLVFTGFYFVVNLFPQPIPFEGNLIVNRLGFNSREERLLLNQVHIDEITIKGKQIYKFSGTKGDFTSNEEPYIKELEELTIQLQDEESYLNIASDSKQTGLQLSELILQQNTQVEQLFYNPDRSLHLELIQPDNSSRSTDVLRPLKLNIGNVAQITCKGNCFIPDLKSSRKNNFSFKHQSIGEFQPLLPSTAIFDIKLHNFDKKPFFGNIDVNKVRLIRQQKKLTDNNYNFYESSIISGVVRIAEQNLNLKKEQFLILGWQNSTQDFTEALIGGLKDISKLRYIHVLYPEESKELQVSDEKVELSESTLGLEIGISGKTSRLAIGINPYLPVHVVQGSFLKKFPNDVMNFFNVVFAALFASLLTRLFSSP